MNRTGDESSRGLGNRLAPARFVVFLALLPISFIAYRLLVPHDGWQGAVAVSFDLAALVFLISVLPLLRDSKPEEIRAHAGANDANRGLVLIITAVLSAAILTALSSQLHPARNGDMAALAKLLATLAIAWIFAHTVCTLHYAHVYYRATNTGSDTGGLEFPATKTPTYLDFAYYALTVGMTFQTSDVTTTSAEIRAITMLHAVGGFIFNIGIIAFTINGLG